MHGLTLQVSMLITIMLGFYNGFERGNSEGVYVTLLILCHTMEFSDKAHA